MLHQPMMRWAPAVFIAFVFVQSLFFKFSDSLETRHIFGTLAEWSGLAWFGQFGAYGVGGVELVAALLLLSPWWAFGAVIALVVITGAVGFHLFTPLGLFMPVFDAQGQISGDDGGTLFLMACFVWLCAAFLVSRDWQSSPSRLRALLGR